jgi:hypothetical protein
MSGGELLDKRVDWVAVTKEYLNELYDQIDKQKHEIEEQEDQIGTLLGALAKARIGHRMVPVYREKAA